MSHLLALRKMIICRITEATNAEFACFFRNIDATETALGKSNVRF